MAAALTVIDALVFVAVVVPFMLLIHHRGSVPRLPAARHSGPLPSLSVVVPARNEAAGIREGLTSLRAQDYPDLEIVVVDDRSSDGTGDVLRELATPERVRVLRVDDVPPGWLGKNHALWYGAKVTNSQ